MPAQGRAADHRAGRPYRSPASRREGKPGPADPALLPRPARGMFTSLLVRDGNADRIADHLDRLDASGRTVFGTGLPPTLGRALARSGSPAPGQAPHHRQHARRTAARQHRNRPARHRADRARSRSGGHPRRDWQPPSTRRRERRRDRWSLPSSRSRNKRRLRHGGIVVKPQYPDAERGDVHNAISRIAVVRAVCWHRPESGGELRLDGRRLVCLAY
jgi:hypothetical protein